MDRAYDQDGGSALDAQGNSVKTSSMEYITISIVVVFIAGLMSLLYT